MDGALYPEWLAGLPDDAEVYPPMEVGAWTILVHYRVRERES